MENVHQSFQQSGEQGKTPLGATSDFLRKSPAMNRVHGVAQNVGEKGLVPSLKQAGGIVQAIENYGASLYKGGDPTVANFISDVAKDAQKKAHPIIKSSQTKIKKMIDKLPAGDLDTKFAKQEAGKTPKQGIPFHPSQGGDLKHHGGDQQDQLKWWQQLSSKMGLDFDKAAANWKEKGGFEGLMANPAFTMGLAFMQAGAEGKTLGSGALDNVMKAGGISQHYKKIIEGRSGDVIEATEGQMNNIKGILESKFNISAPILRGMKPGNQSESYEQAVEDIVMKVQKKVKAKKKAAKASGKDIEVGSRLYEKVIQDMIDNKEINKVGGFNLFGYNIWDSTLEAKPMARGGPIEAGKPYIVGEKGPEVIIPNSDGNVLTNDDSQIFAMLLASNPQLQNVSRTRAERILRSRFPEYFEV